MTTPYHHGDLPRALLAAVGELLDEGGVSEVSLRAVARRAGVSHAAPAHHFGDRAGLLAAYATQGFDAFVAAMHEAHADLPPDATVADAFRGAGRAYVAFGLSNRAWYGVMFRPEMVDVEDPGLQLAGGRAFATVLAVARAALDDDATDDQVTALAMSAWSAVHGFVSLAHDLPAAHHRHVPVPDPMVEPLLDVLDAGMRAHPHWVGDQRPASRIPTDLSDPLVQVPPA